MILLFKKGSKFTGPSKSGEKSSIFPIINLPVYDGGEKVELNDFQWWSYTDKWNEWLKKNPRSWTAESESTDENLQKLVEDIFKGNDPYRKFFDFQLDKIINENRVASFTEFSKLYEQEEEVFSSNSDSRKNTKLALAIDKLISDGSFKKEMSIDELEIGKDYAVVVDFPSEDGSPMPFSRQALKFRKFRETDKFALGYTNYSIPLGKIPETPAGFLEKVTEYTFSVVKAAAVGVALYATVRIAGQAYFGWKLFKSAKNIYKPGNVQKAANALGKGSTWSKMKNFASTAFRGKGTSSIINAARVNLPSGSSIVGNQAFGKSGQLLNLPQTKFVARGAVKRGLISKAASRKLIQAAATRGATTAAASGTSATTGAALASNPIGWIVTAAYAAASGIQQSLNWVSKNQAPRYSEVKSFASGKFSPGKVSTSKPITICWTEDGGAGTWGGIAKALTLSKDDTRTTMDLIKLGNFKGRSVFMLMKVNSKSMEDVLKNNDIVLLVFNNSEEFSRGTLDNDDLVFETIAIKDASELSIASYFIGYDDWENMSSEYAEAPDKPYFVPDNAPEKYPFHMGTGKKKVNVQGNLMDSNELERINLSEILPIPGVSVEISESLVNESETSESIPFAMNFGSFVNSVTEEENEDQIKFGPISGEEEQEKKKPAEEENTKVKAEEDSEEETEWEKEFASINKNKSISYDNPYSQIPLAVYEVEDIEFVDPKESGELPEFKYFIVALESLDAENNQPIGVEVTSEEPVVEPRYGLAEPSDEEKKPEEDKQEEEKPKQIVDEEPEEKTIKTTHKDVSIKSGATKTTIRDKEVDGGVNIYDEFLTDEDKKKLALPEWKNVTYAQIRKNQDGEPQVVVLKNKFAKLGDRVRKIRKGQSGFENAVDFVKRIESKIKYV